MQCPICLQYASLAFGSLTDLRLEVTFEPFPATKTKKGLKAEIGRQPSNRAEKDTIPTTKP